MTRREEWQAILDVEVKRWSSMSCAEVLVELHVRDIYEVTAGSKRYQVEAELLENSPEYIQVGISVDDGSLPASIHPVSQCVICRKDDSRSSRISYP
jgi:hypothetical protein